MQAKKLDNKHTTSINVEKKQKEFLDKNNINLSALVRETIDNLILIRRDLKNNKKKKWYEYFKN